MTTDETKPTEEKQEHHHGFLDTVKDIGKKVVDATILNTHPCGAPIDHTVSADGKFVKAAVDATILNDHPSGAPIGK
jgi:hypothetical protein